MKISEIMTRDVAVIAPGATLREACEKMRDRDIGFLPVCDGERLKGAVTDRDIATRGVAEGHDPLTSRVEEVMSPKIVYLFEDQEVLEAARLMEAKQLRRLAILDRGKRLVGVVSLGDVSTHSKDTHLAAEILERVSEPAPQHVGM
jgi:CBS domain-containing protein